MTQRAFLYGDPRRRHHYPGSSDALTVGGLVAAVGASVVATLLAAKAGTDLAGTLVGATCAPVVSALFTTRRASGYLRAGAVIVLGLTGWTLGRSSGDDDRRHERAGGREGGLLGPRPFGAFGTGGL